MKSITLLSLCLLVTGESNHEIISVLAGMTDQGRNARPDWTYHGLRVKIIGHISQLRSYYTFYAAKIRYKMNDYR